MIYYVFGAVVFGGIAGHFFIPEKIVGELDKLVNYALGLMVFGVGISVGKSRQEIAKLREVGWRVLIVPAAVAFGSLLGASLGWFLFSMKLKELLAVGAGFGWYSLSSVLISRLYSAELGTVAFLANVFRELLAFAAIPVIAAKIGKIAAIAPGGATTMDSTLPLILKVTDNSTALIAFVNGFVLSAIVPFLVPMILSVC